MGRFNTNHIASSSAVSAAVLGLASAASVDALAADLLAGAGRPLLLAPTDYSGTGADQDAALTMPSGLSISSGSKARIKGTALVRTQGTGLRLAEIAFDNLVVECKVFPAWNSTDQGAGTYDTGWRVTNEGHAWQSMVSNNATEPTVASHAGWTDLGAGVKGAWDEVRAADVSVITETGYDTYFADAGDLPTLGDSGGSLALTFNAINGQNVRIEFDGTIASIGSN